MKAIDLEAAENSSIVGWPERCFPSSSFLYRRDSGSSVLRAHEGTISAARHVAAGGDGVNGTDVKVASVQPGGK